MSTESKHQEGNNANTVLGDCFISVLNHFVGTSEYRDWMLKPFSSNGRAFSTNGEVLVSIEMENNFVDQSKQITSVYPIEYNLDYSISLQLLKEKLSLFPKKDCFDETESKCNACYGSCEVEFEFYHNGKDYTSEQECPVCEGEGVILKTSSIPNGKKEFDYEKYFKIYDIVFNLHKIEDLIWTADVLNVENIKLVNQSKNSSLFLIGDVEFLVMGVNCQDDELVLQNIA